MLVTFANRQPAEPRQVLSKDNGASGLDGSPVTVSADGVEAPPSGNDESPKPQPPAVFYTRGPQQGIGLHRQLHFMSALHAALGGYGIGSNDRIPEVLVDAGLRRCVCAGRGNRFVGVIDPAD